MSIPTSLEKDEVSLKERFLKPRTIISFVVAFGILLFLVLRSNVDLSRTMGRLGQSDPIVYVLAFLVYYTSLPLRGLRWRLLLGNAGFQENPRLPSLLGITEILYLGWFVNCIAPAKLGDTYRAYLLRRNSPVSFPTALGSIMAEGIMDMSVIFLLLLGAGVIVIAGLGFTTGATVLWVIGVAFGLVLLLATGLVVLYRFGGHIAGWLPSRLRPFYQSLQQGLLSSLRRLPLLALLSTLIWLAEAGRLFLVSYSLGFSLGVPLTLFIALASAILTLFPLTPAGLGLVEGGIASLLMVLAAFTAEDALSVALLDRSISYWSIILFGAVLLVLSRKK